MNQTHGGDLQKWDDRLAIVGCKCEENRINCDLVIFEGEAIKIVVWEVGGCGKFIGDACVLGLM